MEITQIVNAFITQEPDSGISKFTDDDLSSRNSGRASTASSKESDDTVIEIPPLEEEKEISLPDFYKNKENYKKIKVLGKTDHGKTYLVQAESDGSYAVIKQISMKGIHKSQQVQATRSAQLQLFLDHNSIINVKEVYKTKNQQVRIIMDYCDQGDLKTKLRQYAKLKDKNGEQVYFRKQEVIDIFSQICSAIKYCHNKKIPHGNIKPSNVLFSSDGTAKLVDLNISKVVNNIGPQDEDGNMSQDNCFKYDIWVLGLLLFQICTLHQSFQDPSSSEICEQILKGDIPQIPEHYGKNMQNLLNAMLRVDPVKRININQVVEYFKNLI